MKVLPATRVHPADVGQFIEHGLRGVRARTPNSRRGRRKVLEAGGRDVR
jgi:hypothetical protein